MDIIKTQGNTVKVLDARTGNLKCNIPIQGQLSGNAQMQNGTIVVQIKENAYTRTKIYDARTGNLKANY
jgi:hypothetical protein|tara:strand:+ start:5293 stop:5499 length:207 start_codon:yes stop_codon:yes gene_type:complete